MSYQDNLRPPIIIITGPTSVGKSKVAINIARQIDSEIISADSLQVYKYMDIGTAKLSIEESNELPHHLIDILEPDKEFNAGIFSKLTEDIVAGIIVKKGMSPIICGGTGLYIERFLEGIDHTTASDPEIRRLLNEEAKDKGVGYLYSQLKHIDKPYADRIKPNDTQRIKRAIEVFRLTGKPFSYFLRNQGHRLRFLSRYFVINLKRDILYQNIEHRIDEMFKKGFIEEVRHILDMGYNENLKPLKSIGYLQVIDYLKGRLTYNEAVALIKQKTRHYAKRQLTWFRRVKYANWINISGDNAEAAAIETIIKRCILS